MIINTNPHLCTLTTKQDKKPVHESIIQCQQRLINNETNKQLNKDFTKELDNIKTKLAEYITKNDLDDTVEQLTNLIEQYNSQQLQTPRFEINTSELLEQLRGNIELDSGVGASNETIKVLQYEIQFLKDSYMTLSDEVEALKLELKTNSGNLVVKRSAIIKKGV